MKNPYIANASLVKPGASSPRVRVGVDRWCSGPRSWSGPVAILWLWLLAGCNAPAVVPVDHLTGPGLDLPLPNASLAHWQADFDRLIYDVPRAAKKMHWGVLGIGPTGGDVGSPESLFHARALLPDGRTATIVAWPVDEASIRVAVRVGHFGDASCQKAFVATLGRVLRGKPSRRHRQGFRLPTGPG